MSPPEDPRPPRLLVLLLSATLATSGVVLFEPAPTDLLFAATVLVALLTAPSLSVPPIGMLAVAGIGLFALGHALSLPRSHDLAHAIEFTAITIYMLVLALCVAVLIRRYGDGVLRPMFRAFSLGALVTAGIGILARFHMIPRAELFFRDETGIRVKSTFKDPNVFAPFLVAAVLWTLAVLVERKRWGPAALVALAVYLLGILFSFSRGAYFNLAVALATFVLLHAFVLRDPVVLKRLSGAGFLAALAVPPVLVLALSSSELGDYFRERLSFQDYDSERFGTQRYALSVAVESPLGVGPGEWRSERFGQATHNLYVRTLVETGWLGAAGLLAFLAATVTKSLASISGRGPRAALQVAVLATLTGVFAESIVIDTLHWRHVFLFVGLALGLRLEEQRRASTLRPIDEPETAARAAREALSRG